MNRYALGLSLACILVGLTLTSTGVGAETSAVFPPPPQERPFGQTYSEWAAAYWSWVLPQPASTNPLLDTTGAFCANGQEIGGKVWFLAGAHGGTPEHPIQVTRSCTVPPETALFFPIVNLLSCTVPPRGDPLEQQPPKQQAPEQQTAASDQSRMCPPISKAASGLSATIDGIPVPDIGSYCEKSAMFKVVLPDDPEESLLNPLTGLIGPCRDSGYYLMVRPLSAGEHTIEFTGSLSLPDSPLGIHVTYHITVSG